LIGILVYWRIGVLVAGIRYWFLGSEVFRKRAIFRQIKEGKRGQRRRSSATSSMHLVQPDAELAEKGRFPSE
jgi:hypothetical protein